jgi:hypothetical protein
MCGNGRPLQRADSPFKVDLDRTIVRYPMLSRSWANQVLGLSVHDARPANPSLQLLGAALDLSAEIS